MIDKKKGLASVAALHQAGETTCDRADLHSHDTTERTTGQGKVKGSLGRLQIYCFMDKKMH